MKRVLSILIAVLIALTSLTAVAESVDFSVYNDAELIKLLASVQQEIADRHIEKSAALPEGWSAKIRLRSVMISVMQWTLR